MSICPGGTLADLTPKYLTLVATSPWCYGCEALDFDDPPPRVRAVSPTPHPPKSPTPKSKSSPPLPVFYSCSLGVAYGSPRAGLPRVLS